MKLPEGIRVERFGAYGGPMTYSASWVDTARGRRFHIWLNADRQQEDGWLHSNPIEEVRGVNGHRALDATNATNAPVIAAVLAHCTEAGLFDAALAAEQAKRDEQAAKDAEALALIRKQAAGPALYEAAAPFVRFARTARQLTGPLSPLAMSVESHIAGKAELTIADWDALAAALKLAEEGAQA